MSAGEEFEIYWKDKWGINAGYVPPHEKQAAFHAYQAGRASIDPAKILPSEEEKKLAIIECCLKDQSENAKIIAKSCNEKTFVDMFPHLVERGNGFHFGFEFLKSHVAEKLKELV